MVRRNTELTVRSLGLAPSLPESDFSFELLLSTPKLDPSFLSQGISTTDHMPHEGRECVWILHTWPEPDLS